MRVFIKNFGEQHVFNVVFLQNDRQFYRKKKFLGISEKIWQKLLFNTAVKIFITTIILKKEEVFFQKIMLENQYLWINL